MSAPPDADGRVPTDPRLSRRRRAVQRARRRRMALWGASGAALAAVAWVAFWSPLLAVRGIQVSGGRHISRAQVQDATALVGDNLLLLSTTDVERRVERLPWVKSAAVVRRLPGTVRVEVVERRPAAVLAAEGARWTVDARGRVLSEGVAAPRLPLLGGVEVVGARPGELVRGDAAAAGLRVLRRLSGDIGARVRALFAPSPERVSLALRSGTLVRLGAAERLRPKLAVLRAVLARLERRGERARYVDVRVPETPAVSSAAPAEG
ncbi:MAG TPA: FtsQ-type POTRA domain-containing protein [Actinomycetota bacterium]|nr:FtsQ-type POTRA domain-containing protein [Actinomycetota bacterium]